MKSVFLTVDEEYVEGAGKVIGARGTNSTEVVVQFSEDWDDLSKYVTTRDANGLNPEVIILTPLMKVEDEERTYKFTVGGNALSVVGLMSITFTGYRVINGNEDTETTNTAIAKLRVLPSDYTLMSDSSITPTIAQQMQAEIDDIKEDIEEATHAKEYADAAEISAGEALASQTAAAASAVSADEMAVLARSYAKGDTETRTGEETDNAKYYMEQAEEAAGVFVVEDNLTSESTIHSLSANQGRVLKGITDDITNSKGQAYGIAELDGNGRVPYDQLPESAMEFKGEWNASTNTPTLTPGVGDNGDFYYVTVAGTWTNYHGDVLTFSVNDRVAFDGVTAHDWIKLVAGEVNSVNGKSGQVLLDAEDIPFDKKTSSLISTNTNAAILEVLQKAGVQIHEVTYADYLAHKAEYDATGDMYKITDQGIFTSAAGVSYDHTDSGLTAGNVQGAIDELNSDLTVKHSALTNINGTYLDGASITCIEISKLVIVTGSIRPKNVSIPTNTVLVADLPKAVTTAGATVVDRDGNCFKIAITANSTNMIKDETQIPSNTWANFILVYVTE